MIKASQNKFEIFLKEELQELYNAASIFIEILPLLENEAFTPELKQFAVDHLVETKEQISRLEKSLSSFDKKIKSDTTSSITSLTEDVKRISKHYETNSSLKDAALIGAFQRIEHYFISFYGTISSHAKQLKLEDIFSLLQLSLDETIAADKIITKIAEGTFYAGGVNAKAMKVEKAPK